MKERERDTIVYTVYIYYNIYKINHFEEGLYINFKSEVTKEKHN